MRGANTLDNALDNALGNALDNALGNIMCCITSQLLTGKYRRGCHERTIKTFSRFANRE